jgi:RNA recognition motif. (a.k.a. RRM, RBD, or RNP domain)
MRIWTSEAATGNSLSMANDNDDGAVNDPKEATTTTTTKKRKKTATKEDKAAQKRARAVEKARILDQVPKVDVATGLSYTKQQLRRMKKRVARGLHPIETPAETHERRMRESELKKEEEAEFAGLYVQKERPDDAPTTNQNDDDDDDDKAEEVEEETQRSNDDDRNTGEDGTEQDEEGDRASTAAETARKATNDQEDKETTNEEPTPSQPTLLADTTTQLTKKKPRCKPVPNDYVCSACQNAIRPAHWIYDCPQKKSLRGGNKNDKQLRGLHDPSEKKLFVSGLPFETTVGYVKKLFESKSGIIPTFVKLVKFKDSERCRGQAYLSFASAADAKTAAQQMDGQHIIQSSPSTAKAGAENRPKKDLKLSVTSVLNRSATSKKT